MSLSAVVMSAVGVLQHMVQVGVVIMVQDGEVIGPMAAAIMVLHMHIPMLATILHQ